MVPPKSVIPRKHSYNLRSRPTQEDPVTHQITDRQEKEPVRRAPVTAKTRRLDGRASCNRTASLNDDDTIKCAICLDTERSRKMVDIRCGHRFHAKCSEKWLAIGGACPVCRTPVLQLPQPENQGRQSDRSSRRERVRRRHVVISQGFSNILPYMSSLIIIDVFRIHHAHPPLSS